MEDHAILGKNKGLYYTHYEVFCKRQGHSIPTTYQPHTKKHECGGCNKTLKIAK
jgi:hypothetical protein